MSVGAHSIVRSLVFDAFTLVKGEGILGDGLSRIVVARYNRLKQGDFVTNGAIGRSKSKNKNRADIGEQLVLFFGLVREEKMFGFCVTGPVLQRICFFDSFWRCRRPYILAGVKSWGWGAPKTDSKARIDYLSGNPTDHLYFDHGQRTAVCDFLTRLLRVARNEVVREFYVNDVGIRVAMSAVNIIQLISLLRARNPEAMGNWKQGFVSLNAFIDEVDRDANVFFFLMRLQDTPLEIDLEIAKQQSSPKQRILFVRPN